MAPDIPKIDPDRHPNLGDAAWNFGDEVLRWFFHGHSLSDSKDLLIPFFGKFVPKLPISPFFKHDHLRSKDRRFEKRQSGKSLL